METWLADRLLWSYFVDPQKLSFSSFKRTYCRGNSLSPSGTLLRQALGIMEKHAGENRVFLLCVDELIKLGREEAKSMLSVLSGALTPSMAVCISTLDTHPVVLAGTASGRPISWIPLLPLSDANAMAIFSPVINAIHNTLSTPEEKIRPKAYIRRLQLCISDIGGHPRALIYLFDALQQDIYLLRVASPTGLLRSLIAGARLQTAFLDLHAEHVLAALRGKELLRKEPIPGTEAPRLCDLIERGTFINATTDAAEGFTCCVPRLSPLALQCYQYNNRNCATPEDRLLCSCIEGMFQYDEYWDALKYEEFHAWWEVLHHHFNRATAEMSLLAFYDFPPKQSRALRAAEPLVSTVRIEFGEKTGVTKLRGNFPPNGDIIDLNCDRLNLSELYEHFPICLMQMVTVPNPGCCFLVLGIRDSTLSTWGKKKKVAMLLSISSVNTLGQTPRHPSWG